MDSVRTAEDVRAHFFLRAVFAEHYLNNPIFLSLEDLLGRTFITLLNTLVQAQRVHATTYLNGLSEVFFG